MVWRQSNNTEKSVDNFTLWADGYAETTYKLVIVDIEFFLNLRI